MGSLPSRQNTRNEEADLISNQMYKYPPKSGKNLILILFLQLYNKKN